MYVMEMNQWFIILEVIGWFALQFHEAYLNYCGLASPSVLVQPLNSCKIINHWS